MLEQDLQIRPEPREDQVLDIAEVQIGAEYTAVDLIGTTKIKVLSEPHIYRHWPNVSGLFIDVEEQRSIPTSESKPQKTEISLADFAVIPYEAGNWNQFNFLLKIDKS